MILFNPINPELGTIPSRTNKIFKNRILNLNNPGQELNVNKIHGALCLEEKIQIMLYFDPVNLLNQR